jgi:glutamate-1-semialdehyde aminotransferase
VTRPLDRDGVCTWIERNRFRFPAETVINPIPNMAGERWVLDTEDDYRFCKEIAMHWPWDHGPPGMLNILGILDRFPEMRAINAHHACNERYVAALAEEPIYERNYSASQKQFEKAKKIIPLAAQTFSKSFLQYPQPSPLFLSHGQGGEVFDIDGNAYVDLVSALLPVVLGYRDHDIDTAIRRQLCSGISFSLATSLEEELAAEIVRLVPCAEAVRFGKTGTDATTAAIRAARAFTGRERVLICGGYHGWADWSAERNLGVPLGVRYLSRRIGQTSLEAIEREFDAGIRHPAAQYAAAIVEADAGPQFLAELRRVCDLHGTVLIFDEVITGFRFDLGGAQKLYGVTPDLATFGKAMANGMPLSAVAGRRDIMAKFAPPDNIFYSGTMFGETLSLAASLATIRKLERAKIIPKLWTTGQNLADRVETMMANYGLEGIISLYGEAPFKRLKFRDDKVAALFRKEMVATGTLITASNNICAAHEPSEILRVRRSYDFALGAVSDAIRNGNIDERLAGASVGPTVRQ